MRRGKTRTLERMSKDTAATWSKPIHAAVIAGMVAAGIYVYVPQFATLCEPLGEDLPISSQVLVTTYPFAFLLPLFALAIGWRLKSTPRWRTVFVPLTYIVAIALVCFVVWAIYAPMFELAKPT
jgi:type II secretory pathway component PulF